MNCYPFIEAEKAQQRNVKRACELLKVSRAAYYAARSGRPSDRDRKDAELTTRIAAEHKRSKGRYGVWRGGAGGWIYGVDPGRIASGLN